MGVQRAIHKGEVESLYYKFPTTAIILLGCSSAMICSELIRQVGEFDTSLNTSADWDYFRRLSRIAKVDFVDKPLVNYRRHKSSMSSSSIEMYYRDNKRAVIKQLCETRYLCGTQIRKSMVVLIWIRFQLSAGKALVKSKRLIAALWHIRNLFFFHPWLRR